MRSEGQVRFIKVSSRLQLFAAGGITALLLVWALTIAAMALSSYVSNQDRLSLLEREAKVATSESRLNAYGQDIGKVADDLKRRQTFIESVVDAHLGDLPKDAAAAKPGETVSDSSSEAAQTVKKVSLALPQAATLAQVEARQLSLIEVLTRIADRRSAAAQAKLASLGLNSHAALASLDDKSAQGGPLLTLATSADGSIDPRFQRFGLSLAAAASATRQPRLYFIGFRLSDRSVYRSGRIPPWARFPRSGGRTDLCRGARHGQLRRAAFGLWQLCRDRSRQRPGYTLCAHVRLSHRAGQSCPAGRGDRLDRLDRPLNRAAPALRSTDQRSPG
jgi:hypothetical protein